MSLDAPAITMYYRTIDNATNQEIEGYKLIGSKSNFHFGQINGLYGGESSIVVEFDIWNNEPALYGGMHTKQVSDAVNCRFTAWDNEELKSSQNIQDKHTKTPYIRARCVTQEYPDFKAVAGLRSLMSDDLYGSITNDSGVLLGVPGGDHMIIQTKITLPHYTDPSFKSFVFEFSYDYI